MDERLVPLILGVENPHRVERKSCAARLAQLAFVWSQFLTQVLVVASAVLGVTHRPQLYSHALQAQAGQDRVHECYGLCVHKGTRLAKEFAVDLVELAVAAALNILSPEGGAHAPQLHRAAPGMHSMFHVGPQDPGREFGSEREVAAAPVLEGVHLLLDNEIGRFSHGFEEHFAVLEDWRRDLTNTRPFQRGGHSGAQVAPAGLVLGENIVRAFDGLEPHKARVYPLGGDVRKGCAALIRCPAQRMFTVSPFDCAFSTTTKANPVAGLPSGRATTIRLPLQESTCPRTPP